MLFASRDAIRRRCFARCLHVFLFACMLAALPAVATAQEDAPIPEPEDLQLKTSDGVYIVATVYRPAKEGKDVVPVILIHDHKGRRTDFDTFARMLQAEGHTAIAPDLRGHGDSTKAIDNAGREHVLKPEMLNANFFDATYMRDLEVVKRHLMNLNNEGKLNIEKLCMIGAGYGASVATAYTAWDWHFPSQAFKKNGQDVKALVLISPEIRHSLVPNNRGILSMYAERTFPKPISTMICVGDASREHAKDAQTIYDQFSPHHWKEPRNATAEEIAKFKDLFLDEYKTKLQGAKMFGADLGMEKRIIAFIRIRLVNQTYPWTDRKSALGMLTPSLKR